MGGPRRKPAFAALALSAALVASGCAPPPELRAPSAPLPVAYTASAPVIPSDAAALDRWWTLYRDPQLDALVARALADGTDARLALARLAEARAVRDAALSRFRLQGDPAASIAVQRNESISGQPVIGFPSAAPGAGVGPGVGGASGQNFTLRSASASFNVSYELDLFGRRPVAARAADADLAAARFSYEAARASLVAEVADALFSARGIAAQIEDAEAALRIQRDVLRIVRVRAARGLAADAEAARVDADVAQADAQLATLSAELAASQRAILTLIGDTLSPLASIQVEAALPPPPVVPASLPATLLARRPDVREAEARLHSGVTRAQLQRLELFPRLTLNPGGSLTGTRVAGVSGLGLAWSLGAGLAVPLLDRARLFAELRAEGARAEQAAVAYERAVQIAFSEADQALMRLAADRARVATLAHAERQAGIAYDAARLLFGRGLTDLTTLLDAERVRRTARSAAATARTEALRRSVAVFRALGGGWGTGTNPHADGAPR